MIHPKAGTLRGILVAMGKLRVLDLFSGIGGFSLGLERTDGFETVAFCEVEPHCRRVLAKHWPEVPCYDDVRTLTGARLAADGIGVDVICGGFPCQDISATGKREGINGSRSGLWFEYARLIGELRPCYVIVENVADLLIRGFDRVLGSLAALGYDAEWDCISAAHVGTHHRRDRAWVVAYPERRGLEGRMFECPRPTAGKPISDCRGRFGYPIGTAWSGEPELAMLVHGLPDHVAGVGAIGNAVVPAIPELIGRGILASRRLAP
jgi:DNA (cytosine-5)-methyltransferase 1